ncbi:ATP synthase epsilon chain, chloroplastic [Glycine soja]
MQLQVVWWSGIFFWFSVKLVLIWKICGEIKTIREARDYDHWRSCLSTNSGQIGVLPNHAPIATVIDIGILRIHLKDQWLTMALMGGFARINNNEIIVLVNDAEKDSDIDPQDAQQTLEIAKANLNKAEGKRQTIEANLALRRARTRVEAINTYVWDHFSIDLLFAERWRGGLQCHRKAHSCVLRALVFGVVCLVRGIPYAPQLV